MMQFDPKKVMKQFVEQKDLMEDQIRLGIESNRKGYFRLNFINQDEKPVTGAKVTIRQKTHDFKFGCNIFKLGCFAKDEDNAKYEEAFADLFNMATIPLYWDAFEPEDGNMRFDRNSRFIDRRIPPEQALAFCEKHHIEAKGHPLFWHVTTPDWLPGDFDDMKLYWLRRLQAIADRYDGVIKTFDCINEVCAVPNYVREKRLSDGYRNALAVDYSFPYYAFERTAHYFKKSRLVLNEASGPWSFNEFKGVSSHYYLLCKDLLRSGARVDILGFQYHIFNQPENLEQAADDYFNPRHLFRVMDAYSTLQLPMSVSEITLPGYDDDLQAQLFRNLYRIWFSAQNMESIIYWNLGDQCAAVSDGWAEDQYKSGLIRNDFSKKPSYDVIRDLIKKEWQTNLDLDTKEDHVYFKAFYGEYEISVLHQGRKITRTIHLSKKGFEEFDFRF